MATGFKFESKFIKLKIFLSIIKITQAKKWTATFKIQTKSVIKVRNFMYISGHFNDLENRLHQQALTSVDLASYAEEACSYYSFVTGISAAYFVQKWNNEFSKKQYFTGLICAQCAVNELLIGGDGNLVLDVQGYPIYS